MTAVVVVVVVVVDVAITRIVSIAEQQTKTLLFSKYEGEDTMNNAIEV